MMLEVAYFAPDEQPRGQIFFDCCFDQRIDLADRIYFRSLLHSHANYKRKSGFEQFPIRSQPAPLEKKAKTYLTGRAQKKKLRTAKTAQKLFILQI